MSYREISHYHCISQNHSKERRKHLHIWTKQHSWF